MKKSQIIKSKLDALIKLDRLYNNAINEGGEGYERDSTAALYVELKIALAAEFAEEWTHTILATRGSKWNDGVADMVTRLGADGIHWKDVRELSDLLGFSLDDIKQAKKLLNVA